MIGGHGNFQGPGNFHGPELLAVPGKFQDPGYFQAPWKIPGGSLSPVRHAVQSYHLILSRSCCECYRTSPQTNPTQRIKLTSTGRLSDQPGFEFKILIPPSLNVIASATSTQILLKQMHSFYQTDQPALVLHFKNPI